MLSAFGVDGSRLSDKRQNAGRGDYLSLGFRDFRASGFETHSSFGVWAKNSACDIAGWDARALAALICSAIFR